MGNSSVHRWSGEIAHQIFPLGQGIDVMVILALRLLRTVVVDRCLAGGGLAKETIDHRLTHRLQRGLLFDIRRRWWFVQREKCHCCFVPFLFLILLELMEASLHRRDLAFALRGRGDLQQPGAGLLLFAFPHLIGQDLQERLVRWRRRRCQWRWTGQEIAGFHFTSAEIHRFVRAGLTVLHVRRRRFVFFSIVVVRFRGRRVLHVTRVLVVITEP